MRGNYLTTGPMIEQFEQAIAQYVSARFAVVFSSGTAALHGAVYAAGIGEGDEVVTTPMTFAASANCVLYQRGNPIFADIDPRTGNIDPSTLEALITSRTKAVIPVDYTDRPVPMDDIKALAHRYGLIVIEDAAHALGATYRDRRVGASADMTMFSFHPVKQITTGEGGVIVTNSPTYYEKLLKFRSHGITKDNTKLLKHDGPWYYEMQGLGYNYRMTDIQAALGLSQLQCCEEFLDRRRTLVRFYREELSKVEGIVVSPESSQGESAWHLFVLQLEPERLCGRETRDL